MSEVCFTADPDGLDALSQQLSNLEDGMQGLTVTVDAYAPSDLSPSGDVWNALNTFSQAWSGELKTVNGNVSALQQRLTSAGTMYRTTEDKIGGAAQQGTASLGGQPS